MIISFIVLTTFFNFNELKIVRQPGYLLFKVKPTIYILLCRKLPFHVDLKIFSE